MENLKRSIPPFVLPLVCNMKVGDIGFICSTEIAIYGIHYYVNRNACYHKKKLGNFSYKIERTEEDYFYIDFDNGNLPFYQKSSEPLEAKYAKFAFASIPRVYDPINSSISEVNYDMLVSNYGQAITDKQPIEIDQLQKQLIEYIEKIVVGEHFVKKLEKFYYWENLNGKIANSLKELINESIKEYITNEKFRFMYTHFKRWVDNGHFEWASKFIEYSKKPLTHYITHDLNREELEQWVEILEDRWDFEISLDEAHLIINEGEDISDKNKKFYCSQYSWYRNIYDRVLKEIEKLDIESIDKHTLAKKYSIEQLQEQLDEIVQNTNNFELAATYRDAIRLKNGV